MLALKPRSVSFVLVIVLLFGLVPAAGARAESLSGTFLVVWGDGRPGAPAQDTRYFVTGASGGVTRLAFAPEVAEAAGGILALNRQRVTIAGTRTGPGTFDAQSIAIDGTRHDTPMVDHLPWINLLCKFSDVPDEPRPQSYFNELIGNSEPALNYYWREQSYNLADIDGSASVNAWLTLPRPWSYYVHDGMLDMARAFGDCTGVADAQVYFPNFTGINMAFNYELDGYAWGGTYFATLDGVSRVWSATWLPPWGYTNAAPLAHEMGHGFGLPHSSGNYGQDYDNFWDVMSLSMLCNPRDPTFRCIGQHTISFHKNYLGWITPGEKFTYPGTGQSVITLERIAQPQTSNYKMAQIPIGGSSTHFYTVEARYRAGRFDAQLPGDAVIIHDVLTTRTKPALVIDIDGNGNTGDEGAMWRVGETFSDAANGIYVTVVSATASGFVVAIGPPAVPQAGSLRPAAAPTGGCAFVLAVTGANFAPASVVRWNGANRTTTYVSAGELRAAIPASDVASGGTASVTVYTPPPGGGTSQALAFTVLALSHRVYVPAAVR